MSIVRLTEGARVTRQSVTKHLHVLAGAGLVRSTRVGRDHIWEIEPRRLGEAQRGQGFGPAGLTVAAIQSGERLVYVGERDRIAQIGADIRLRQR